MATLTQRSNPLRMHLTPANSPMTSKSSPIRSPTKFSKTDVALSLKQVIGTTTVSSNAIDSRPSSNSFAFTAGSAAVVATIQEDGKISQRFFRARPSTNNPFSTQAATPLASSDPRARNGMGSRDVSSPFMSPQLSDMTDSPSFGRLTTARDRIKAVSCVSFSRDNRLLAVGETGHKPRVLLFSTANDAPSDVPLATMSDHTFGVRSVAFSPDGQYLASLGFVNDGFLYIWAIGKSGSATLCVRNKCTSNVRAIAWLGGCLVTVGTRHVKVWRVEESVDGLKIKPNDPTATMNANTQKTLMGRNCVLGPLLDATFACVAAISETKAIVCTDKGDIGLLNNQNDIHELKKIGECGFPAISVALDGNGLVHITGQGGRIVHLESSLLLKDDIADTLLDLAQSSAHGLDIAALIFLKDYMVMVDTQRSMWLQSLRDWNLASGCKIEPCKLPGHSGPVQGVSAFSDSLDNRPASFLTWSGDGNIIGWKEDGTFGWEVSVDMGRCVSDEGPTVNDLRVVEEVPGFGLATGDRLGILRIVDFEGNTIFEERAHSAEITGISTHVTPTASLIATSGRDRTVQIFVQQNSGSTWSLLQTLDEHVGAVLAVKFSRTGHRLYSASSDRTVVVRDLITRQTEDATHYAFLMLRTITFKATPACIALDAVHNDILLTSTIDRIVHRHDTSTGILINSFKTLDLDGSDSVVLSSMVSLQIPSLNTTIIAGVSSTDKSVRLYSESGYPASRDWGHTEGLSGIVAIPRPSSDSCQLVTASIDGTLFIWDANKPSSRVLDNTRSSDLSVPNSDKESLATKSPLRRVISHSEIARFHRSSPSTTINRDDSQTATPVPNRSPKKRTSRYALPSVPKIDFGMFLPSKSAQSNDVSPTVRKSTKRSSSPPPPTDGTAKSRLRRSTLTSRSRMKSCTDIRTAATPPLPSAPTPPLPQSKDGELLLNSYNLQAYPTKDLTIATEQICQNLRAYRRKLMAIPENLRVDQARELERELALTTRAVGEKVNKRRNLDENLMVQLLEEHGERLVEMLGDRLQKLKTGPSPYPLDPASQNSTSDRDETGSDDERHDRMDLHDGQGSVRSASTSASLTSALTNSTGASEAATYHSGIDHGLGLSDAVSPIGS